MSIPFVPTRRSILAAGAGALIAAPAIVRAQTILDAMNGPAPWWVLRGTVPGSLDFDFANGRYYQVGLALGLGPAQLLNVSRASTETNLLPTSPAGYIYTTFGSNMATITPGIGLQVFQSATNLSAYPTAPQNETINIPTTGSYTLWVNGTGSATVSAGTASGSGFGTASQGSPVTFTIGSTGTVNIAVTGSLMALQLEQGIFGTPFIPQAGGTRALDLVTVNNPLLSLGTMGQAIVVYYVPSSPIGISGNQILCEIDDGSASNRCVVYRIGGGTSAASMVNTSVGASSAASYSSSVPWNGETEGKIAFSSTTGHQASSFNGNALITTSGNFPVGMNTVRIGNNANTNAAASGCFKRIALFNVALPDNTLIGLSQ